MFKRVIFENWAFIVSMACFAFTVLFYGVMVTRTMLMKKEKREHLAALPLED
ncbi:MAG: hypothetical protein KDK99_03900 [Verrucomicrobiales bacterium]|nr:hypothetical protein [Verrucomicrobiales bacterium]